MYYVDYGGDYMNICNLSNLKINKTGEIIDFNCNSNIKRRLLDLGILKGSNITPIFRSPFNDPTAYLVIRTVIALRKDDAEKIIVTYE